MSSSPSSALASTSVERARADEPQRMLELASPLGVGGVLEAPWDTGVDDHERGVREGHGPAGARANRSRAGSRARSDPSRHAAWSRMPHGTPTARSSARWQRRASSSGSSSKSATAQSASASATSRAADDESPAPDGEVGRDRARQADRGPTGVGELGGDRLHVSRPSLGARAASVGGDGLRVAVALGHERDLALRSSRCEPDAVLDRDGQHEPAAVVGVLADEVDAPRRPDAELRFSHCAARLTHSISGAVSGTGRRA